MATRHGRQAWPPGMASGILPMTRVQNGQSHRQEAGRGLGGWEVRSGEGQP